MPSKPDPCSELSMTITKLALNIGSRPEIKSLADVTAELQKHIPEITRREVVDAIVEATTGHKQALDDVAKKINDLKREAKSDAGLRQKIAALEKNVKEGSLPAGAEPRPNRASETVKQLREIRDDLKKQVKGSEPAVRERLVKQIDALTERLNDVAEAPAVQRPVGVTSKEIERLTYERDKIRRQIHEKIDAMRPKTFWTRTVGEPLNLARSIMTSMDFSAPGRQGAILSLAHPIRAASAFPSMFKAFASPRAAAALDRALEKRPNAPIYARAKLHLSPSETTKLSAQEEAFMSRLAGKIPGVAGSQRAYVAFLNKLRADSFDAMAETLGRHGDLTIEEASAVANFVNVATGRGSLGKAEQASVPLATAFFAPRLVASRFQFLAGQPLVRGTAATRKLIAAEYARFLTGAAVVLGLGVAGGGEVETDPRSSDFAKLRFGDTRIDPFAGLTQVVTLAARMGSGESKDLDTGRVRPADAASILGRFVRTKLAPAPGMALTALSGKNVIGQQRNPGEAAAEAATPMAMRDIYNIMRSHGVPEGTALSILNLFGVSVQVHDD